MIISCYETKIDMKHLWGFPSIEINKLLVDWFIKSGVLVKSNMRKQT